MYRDAPCKKNSIDCPNRHRLCWNDCAEYQEWKRKSDLSREERYADVERRVPIWNKRKGK